MNIYVFDSIENGNASQELLIKVIKDYCSENGIKMQDEPVIIRPEGKKPKLQDSTVPLRFNVSHSGKYWVCAIGSREVGIDIQVMTPDAYEKISNRYFTEKEKTFVMENGRKGFFRIWSRKEAWAKYHGYSIFKVIKNVNTVENGRLKDSIYGISIKEIDIAEDSICVIAMGEGEDTVCLKRL